MRSEIILIGPIGVGKSTQGELLAAHLGLPQCAIDDHRWTYYQEIGYDELLAKHLRESGGFIALYRYWKPFEAHAVERLLSEHHNCVIDFGAGHSVYDEPELFQRVQCALAPYANVVLLLPSPDLEESVQILHQQQGHSVSCDFDFTDYFVKHPANHALAKFVVYTQGKTPVETRDEILRLVQIEATLPHSTLVPCPNFPTGRQSAILG
jgi:shikimate kinase